MVATPIFLHHAAHSQSEGAYRPAHISRGRENNIFVFYLFILLQNKHDLITEIKDRVQQRAVQC